MVAIRVVVLLFLVAYSWQMGQLPPEGLNSFGKFVSLMFFVVAPAFYMLPTYEAWARKHTNLTAILLINILLGWSLIGWVVALVWAFKRPEVSTTPARLVPAPQEQETPSKPIDTRACPFYAEEVKMAAIKCKHCGSALEAQSTV